MSRAIVLVEGYDISPQLQGTCAGLDVELVPNLEFLATDLPRLMLGPIATAALGGASPFRGFIEWSPVLGAGLLDACVTVVEQGGICFAATTATVMAEDPAVAIVKAALRLCPALADMQSAMELALVEAMANALIHGNLGIGSGLRISAEGLSEFNRLVTDSLRNPALANRYVLVSATPDAEGMVLAVSDEGDGYDVAQALAHPPGTFKKSGRGLELIQKLAGQVEGADHGRTLRMRFCANGMR